MVNLPCESLEMDGIRSFVQRKDKTVTRFRTQEVDAGSVRTWMATDPVTKLGPAWHIGGRSQDDCAWFISNLSARVKPDIRPTTDGLKAYARMMIPSIMPQAALATVTKQYDDMVAM